MGSSEGVSVSLCPQRTACSILPESKSESIFNMPSVKGKVKVLCLACIIILY